MKLNLNTRELTISTIVTMQNKLNSKADPQHPQWRKVRTREDFILAAILEFSELIESTPWKWWKRKPEMNHWNLKIEAIDILHFLASVLLIDGLPTNQDVIIGTKNKQTATLLNKENLVNRTYALSLCQKIISGKDIINTLDSIMHAIALPAEELSAIYVAKYALNEIRWSSGYADGTYQKHHNGLEDNVFLKEIVEDFLITPTAVLQAICDKVQQTLYKK